MGSGCGVKMRQKPERRITVALTGNPNVGKSTLFNALTGSHQHTGNWPGKTVGTAQGIRHQGDTEFVLTDLPGTYSLRGSSPEEIVAASYLQQEEPDCTVVVCDGSCLERSLLLALQVLQIKDRVVVCVNLMDEAGRRGITVDSRRLSVLLQAPVVLTSAGRGEGIEALLLQIRQTALSPPKLQCPTWEEPVAAISDMVRLCQHRASGSDDTLRYSVDRLIVSRRFGVPLLYLILFFMVWLTVWGANYPAQGLESIFAWIYRYLSHWMVGCYPWLRGILLDGIYATCTNVLTVMLPPVTIFFLLFSFLEDVGYLPRMAFLLDPCMACCGGCGKQALTLCMGLGCNAVGVMGCRFIESPRKRLAAILTNAMIPCNGRFPALILLGSLFFSGIGAPLAVAACVALGVVGAMAVSGLLNRTFLRSDYSTFIMEIPPFRRPRLGKILRQSLLERTLSITLRTLKVAAPAGAVLWLISQNGWLMRISEFLDPVGTVLGMSGVILLGFMISLPANELLIPAILMTLTGATLISSGALSARQILGEYMTLQMAVCTMVFTVFHWPCATTLMTIHRETGSIAKTAAAAVLPTAVGCVLCIVLQLLL